MPSSVNTASLCLPRRSNKWVLYSSTVILLSFILLSDFSSSSVRVVSGSGREDSNDIGTRHVDKIPGKGGLLSPSSGKSAERSHHHHQQHDSNEVHSSFRFPSSASSQGGDFEEDEEEDSNYDDEDASYYDQFGDSHEIKPADVEYLDYYEKEHHQTPERKPQIAKCCPYPEAIYSDGKCKPFRNLEARHNQKEWFPTRVFDGTNFIPTNISEWDIQTAQAHSFNCEANESTEIVSDVSLFAIVKDGSLYLLKHQKVVPPLQFCVDQQIGKGEGRVVKSCFSREELCGGNSSSCLRKCCPEGSFVDEKSSRCTRTNLSETYNFRSTEWTVLHEKPDCQFGHSLLPINGSFSVSEEDGSLVTPFFAVPFLKYCLDHFTNLKSEEDENELHTPVVKVLMCFNQTQAGGDGDPFDGRGLHSVSVTFATTIGIALVLSATSIAIAALVSWRLPELRSLHGKCQLSHLATLFCLFICLAIVQLGRDNIPGGLCKFFAVFIHTCALSSFLWLNLLCFNIYMTFRSLRPPLAARRDENRRLFFLCIYAWGIPASFVAFLFVLDEPGRLDPMPRPEYGVLKCLMSSRDAEFAYLFGPVGVLLLINGLLFCLTAQELLCGLWRLDNSDSITFRRKSMGLVVAKLGIVMGMGWILDVLSWGFSRKFPFLFYAGDVFNALQGVFICIVLLWRKRVLEVLHLRKPSITKDETLTVRPFLPKNGVHHTNSHLDNDTSLVIVQDQ